MGALSLSTDCAQMRSPSARLQASHSCWSSFNSATALQNVRSFGEVLCASIKSMILHLGNLSYKNFLEYLYLLPQRWQSVINSCYSNYKFCILDPSHRYKKFISPAQWKWSFSFPKSKFVQQYYKDARQDVCSAGRVVGILVADRFVCPL